MFVQTIKYSVTLMIGVAVGYYAFTYSSESKANIESTDILAPSITPLPIEKIDLSRIKVGDSINQETLNKLDKLDKLVKSQQDKINELQSKLAVTIQADVQNDELSDASTTGKLEAISMKEFENLMTNQYIDKFRGFAVEIEGDEFGRMTQSFDSNINKADWNDSYEDNINTFIYEADPDGIHIIDQISCNNFMCRLKVITDESEQWEKIIYSMTQQGWFESITLKEKSDDPANFNYFLTGPRFN